MSGTADDPLICLCARVTESTVRSAKSAGVRDVAGLREATGANTGCGDCLCDLEELLAADRSEDAGSGHG